MIDQHAANLKKYYAIAIEVGTSDGLLASNKQLHDAMARLRFPHSYEEYDGDHTNKVRERIEKRAAVLLEKPRGAGQSDLSIDPALNPFPEETAMNRFTTLAFAACAALLLASVAHADVTLNSVRVAAADTVALAKFYQSAFVMQEVNRIDVPGGPEIFVNFGATVEAAKANRSMPIVSCTATPTP